MKRSLKFEARTSGERISVRELCICGSSDMIVSHHGEYEFGSPKSPDDTRSGDALHFLDSTWTPRCTASAS